MRCLRNSTANRCDGLSSNAVTSSRFTSSWTPAPQSSRRRRPYYYSTHEQPYLHPASEDAENEGDELWDADDEIRISDRPKVVIIGGGPNRIGQGIEFDYCCVHAAYAMRDLGYESVMVNSNPETVSTDYDTSDLLFFEPLTHEDVLNVCERLNGQPFRQKPTPQSRDREGAPGDAEVEKVPTSTGADEVAAASDPPRSPALPYGSAALCRAGSSRA